MAANSVGGFICTSVALSSPTLDLSRTGLAELPQELYNARHVECLYLEGNKLTSIPDDFFQHLPNLQWLDLRNNRLTQLPSSIGTLRLMKALLLEGNLISSLPPELGQLTGLTGLNLSGNPLTVPPQSVVEQGTKAVLQYLRSLLCPQVSESSISPNCQSPVKRKDIHFSSPVSGNCLPTCQQHQGLLAFPTLQPVQLRPLESQAKTQLSSNRTPQLPEKTRRVRKAQQKRKPDSQASTVAGLVRPKHLDKLRTKKTAKEKSEIADEIQKVKDRESLKEWRDEARCLQRQHTLTKLTGNNIKPMNVLFKSDTPSHRLDLSDLSCCCVTEYYAWIMHTHTHTGNNSSTDSHAKTVYFHCEKWI
jgi:hypothetical protein